jgi:pimeloyl-ACP methyl ester carboxylesterase
LPSGKPGAIIWSRAVTGGSTLRGAASNTLVLYHTVSVSGHDIAVSGLVSLPTGTPPAGGWPIISWAHGTTGNAPQCAPSRFTKQNNEQRFLEQWIAAGFAIAQTDYEGESTPGLHPYFSGTAGARDTIDIVRAARQAYPQIGGRWFVMGHSEGGTVALFTAADAQAWGPGMQLLGAVAYAPGTGVTGFVGQMMMTQQPTALLPYAAMMVEGIASTDPALDLRTIFSAQGLALLPSLQSECLDALMSAPSWRSMPPAQMFRPNAVSDALLHDFEINEPSTLTIHVPLLIEQGRNDDLVPYALTADLRSGLCANGTRLELDAVDNATHQTILPDSFERVKTWILDRLAGKPATPNCS